MDKNEKENHQSERNIYLWTLYVSMQLLQFSTQQLRLNPIVRRQERKRVQIIHNFIQIQLATGYKNAKATKKDINFSEDFSSQNWAAMLEMISQMSVIPSSQTDWLLAEFNKLAIVAVNRFNTEEQKKKNEDGK